MSIEDKERRIRKETKGKTQAWTKCIDTVLIFILVRNEIWDENTENETDAGLHLFTFPIPVTQSKFLPPYLSKCSDA